MRIVLFGDDDLAVHGMETVLRQGSDSELKVLRSSIMDATTAITHGLRADVFVLLVRSVDRQVVTLVRRLLSYERSGLIPVLVLADKPSAHADQILAMGSCVALRHKLNISEVFPLVRIVAAGYLLVERRHARRLAVLAAGMDRRQLGSGALDLLTPRELDVFELMAAGRSNTEIAELLLIARSTVKSHVERIFEKLDIHDRVQVALFAANRQSKSAAYTALDKLPLTEPLIASLGAT